MVEVFREIIIPFTSISFTPENSGKLFEYLQFFEIESLIWFAIIFVAQSVCHNVMIFNSYIHEFDNIKESKLKYEDLDERINKRRDKMPVISENDDKWHEEHKAISINGYWYDVTNFIPLHPGGEFLIKSFLRCDATSSFYGNHPNPEKILQKRFPVAIHETDKPYLENNRKMNTLYWKLHTKYTELGLFHRSKLWLCKIIVLNFFMGAISWYVAELYPKNWFLNGIICGNFVLGCAF